MSRPQGWSSLGNSRLLHVGVERHLAGNAPFPPLAETLTAQPCQGVVEKVSLFPFTCNVLEGADNSRHTLQANENRQNRGSSAASAAFTWAGPEDINGPRSLGNGGPQPSLGTDDSWSLRRRHGRGYRGTLTLPRGPGPWQTPPAGTANAAPMPALTAARAPRGSWSAPSTPLRGQRKRLHPGPYTLPRRPGPTVADTSGQQRLFRQSRP